MGGSSGGGSQGSGAISYPSYIESAHYDWLTAGGVDDMDSSIVDLMKEGMAGANPYTGETVYDPATDITEFEAAVTAFSTFVTTIDPDGDWAGYMDAAETQVDSILSDTTLDAEIAANDAIIDDRITTDILPRFQLGMRDINAVISSSFVIGQAIIESFAQRDKDKFAGDLRLSNYKQRNEMIVTGAKDILNLFLQQMEYYKIANHYLIESKRIKVVMFDEELTQQLKLDENDALWDLSIYQYGGNVMAAISGGASTTKTSQPSMGQKALGGALSGAAAGAMMTGGNPLGAAAGALIGGIGGALL